LSGNKLSGSIPDLSNLTKLQVLDLSNNSTLTGAIPTSLASLTGLTTLNLSGNQLTGAIPPLSALTKLTTIDVRNNSMASANPSVLYLDPTVNYGILETQLTGTNQLLYNNCLSNPIEIPVAQCQALFSLYSNTNGTGWTDKSWNTSITPCSWKGITCTTSGTTKTVTGIALPNNKLTGTLPASLASLTALTNLNLSGNQLTGAIPPLSALTQLTTIDLSINKLSGAIPTLSALTKLTTINLSNNQMDSTGTKPQLSLDPTQPSGYYGALKTQLLGTPNNLRYGRCLTATGIPLNQCQALLTLYSENNGPNWSPKTVNWNNTDTPCTWEGITCSNGNVTEINLTSHNLTGTLPNLSALTSSLQKLQLGSNHLTVDWSALTALTNLQVLDLRNNQLTGTFPASLTTLTALTTLYLKGNQLTGVVPVFNKSITVDLSGNPLYLDPTLGYSVPLNTQLVDNKLLYQRCLTVPTSFIPQCQALLTLYNDTKGNAWTYKTSYSYSWNTSNPPCSWEGITCDDNGNVTAIDLTNHNLNGTLPNLSALTSLQQLNLSNNPLLTGHQNLRVLTSLQKLQVSGNTLLTTVPADWSSLTNLRVLDLSNNPQLDLSSNPPAISLSNLKALTSLQQLLLSGNKLTVVPDLTSLTDLQLLDLSYNELPSPLPDFSVFKNLQQLLLSHNPLAAVPDLNQLKTLQLLVLDLSYTQLPSPLADFSVLTSLQQLLVSGNDITGVVPDWSTTLTKLQVLDLSHNQLEGPLPNFSTKLQKLLLGSNKLATTQPTATPPKTIQSADHQLTATQLADGQTVDTPATDTPTTGTPTTDTPTTGTPTADTPTTGTPTTDTPTTDTPTTTTPATDPPATTPPATDPQPAATQSPAIIPNLTDLKELQVLDLSNNQLLGKFPDLFPGLTTLTQLQQLDLSQNQLSGELPKALGNLVTLRKLFLNDNQLTGLIPELNALINLESLSLKNNQLQGPIPALNNLHSWKLSMLDLSGGNATTSNPELCKDPNLTYGEWARWNRDTADWINVKVNSGRDEWSRNWIVVNSDLNAFSSCLGTITGTKYNDILDNYPASVLPIPDAGEPGLAKHWIIVTNPVFNLNKDTIKKFAVQTDANGVYTAKVLYGTNTISTLPFVTAPPTPAQIDLDASLLTPAAAWYQWSSACAATTGTTDTGKTPGPTAWGKTTSILFPQWGFCDITLTLPPNTIQQQSVKVPMALTDSIIVKTSDGQDAFKISPHNLNNGTDSSAQIDLDASLLTAAAAPPYQPYQWTTTCAATATGTKTPGPTATGITSSITFPQEGFCDITLTTNNTFKQQSVPVPMATKDSIIVKTSDGRDAFQISPHDLSNWTVEFMNSIFMADSILVVDPDLQQQTTPVRNPPVTTPMDVKTSWIQSTAKHSSAEVNFGVHGLNALTVKFARSRTINDTSTITVKSTRNGVSSAVTCNADCTLYYSPTDQMTLETIASYGTTFTGWTGDCGTATGTVNRINPYSITKMDSNKSCIVHLQGFTCDQVKTIPTGECQALVSLFDSTNGTAWTNSIGWRTASDPCTWYGVTCTPLDSNNLSKVSSVALPNNGLNGMLPSNWDAFTGLQTLDVSGNKDLSSVLPPSVAAIASTDGTGLCKNPKLDYGAGTAANLPDCPQLAPVAAFTILPPKSAIDLDASLLTPAAATYQWTTACATTITGTKTPGPTATGIKSSIIFPQRGFCDITLTTDTNTIKKESVKVPMVVTDSIKDSIIVKTTDGKDAFQIFPHNYSGLTVSLDASASDDPDGDIDSYTWTTTCDVSATGMITAITFPRAATCDITLTVMDDAGGADSITQRVTVPIAGLTVVKESHELDNPGSGQVIMVPNNPVGLNCSPGICMNQQGNYYPGNTVRLVAKPYPGSVFAGWEGDCSNDNSTVDVDASVLKLPEATTIYTWKTSCTTKTPVVTGVGVVKTAITFPPGENCSITLTAGTITATSQSMTLPMTEDLIRVKKPGSLVDDAFYILPHANLSVTMNEQSKSCTAYFDVDPNPPTIPKLTVQLWDAKTGTQAAPGPAPEIGWVIDNRLTINLGNDNFGDDHHKSVTYYNAGTYVRLRSLPSHLDKVNSGSKTYWEFAQWDCYNESNPSQKVEPVMNPTAKALFMQKGTLKTQIDTLLRKPQVRFPITFDSTICRAYFNRELDIAGQELRKRTYDVGTIDTDEDPKVRYRMDFGLTKDDTNAERLREVLYWAQPAILTVKSQVDLSTSTSIEATWPNHLNDVEFFRKSLEGNGLVGKWTKSVRIRKNAEVKGFSGASGTVLGYYIEVRVMLVKYPDRVEEEVPVLIDYSDMMSGNRTRQVRATPLGRITVRATGGSIR
jgi:Leucine-rich repeat (LRR) protein